jgi:hypothetical protein
MNKSNEIKVNITSRATHRGLEKSMTLNRRYVKRPTKLIITDGTEEAEAAIKKAAPRIEYHKAHRIAIADDSNAEIAAEKAKAKISHINIMQDEKIKEAAAVKTEATQDLPPAPNPYQAAIDRRKAENEAKRAKEISSRALKDAAIARALADMEARGDMEPSKAELREERIAERVMLQELSEKKDRKAKKADKEIRHLKKRKGGRILLALATSAACVIALAAIVKVNLPNISVKVAAVQTGVEASYPSYIPRDFNLSGVYTNDQNSVIIEFNGPEDKKFTLAEEKSSWDSNALLTNYVKGAYGSNYDIIREQGITIYINYSNAAWVNNGTFYRITANAGVLSKKQIKNIVGSL